MILYYVNPADTSDLAQLVDQSGRSNTPLGRTTLPTGETVEKLDGPIPESDIYEGRPDTAQAPDYNTYTGKAAAFNGAVNDVAAYVQETDQYQQIPIADLYEIKRGEVAAQDDDVRYNAVDTSLASSWWVVITEKAQQELLWVATGSNSREIRSQSWPTGPNTPVVAVYNANNQRVRREPIPNQGAWDTIELEIAQHLQQTSNATKASGDALDAAYDNGNGDWGAVAAHDPADPAWGYPPTVDGAEMRAVLFQ